jgi:hypothetical protein
VQREHETGMMSAERRRKKRMTLKMKIPPALV